MSEGQFEGHERVAIPRLPNRHAGNKPGRVSRACDECRSRKAKCDGRKPVCTNCSRVRFKCVYSEPKRDRDRTELEATRAKVDHYEKILRDITEEVDDNVANKIKRALLSSSRSPDSREDMNSPIASLPSSSGSPRGVDTLDEDINHSRDSRATGYHGKTSEVSWIRFLEMQSQNTSDTEMDLDNIGTSPPERPSSTASVNYRVESAVYPGLEADNIYALPSKEFAEQLVKLFMESVQPSLPIIRQDLFLTQFNSFYSAKSTHPGRKWLAVLNLVFAIATKLCLVSGQTGPNTDHQYFSRAQTLNISESLVEDHEDLQQVQVEALAAFYLLCSSHINRAWKMIGTAARSSVALGLHLQATHSKLDVQALEARHKLWWSIFILENRLSIMTGRASTLRASFLSVPPPLASEDMDPFTNAVSTRKGSAGQVSDNPSMSWTMDQDQSLLKAQRKLTTAMIGTNELYFFHLADLIVISHAAFTQVYSIDHAKRGWDDLYTCIDYYNDIMLDWRSGLPDSMSFEITSWAPNITIQDAYRISLAMHYHSSRIILTRPCLARKKDTKSDCGNNILRPRKDIEAICLNSALAMISIFPEEPNISWLRHLPWWNILHFLVQATTIFLINIALNSSPKAQRKESASSSGSQRDSPEKQTNPETIYAAVNKALRWQFHLGQTDDSARRAFELCRNCARRVDSRIFDLNLNSEDSAFASSYLEVPSDQTHQQYRSKTDVPYSQFAGTGGFGYDTNMDAAALAMVPGDEINTMTDGTVGLEVDIDMNQHLPEPDRPDVELDQVLEFLA